MEDNKTIIFKGRVERKVFDNGSNFQIYSLSVDNVRKYPSVELNKYGSASISGDIGLLVQDCEYEVEGTPYQTKYGISYNVERIKRDAPKSEEEVLGFLKEIVSEAQAEALYGAYPDIVDRIMQNRLDDVDLNKVRGIKEHRFNIIKAKVVENFCLMDIVNQFKGYLTLSEIKKIYNKYGSIEKVNNSIRKEPYESLCRISGIGFKKADDILLKIEKISKEEIKKGLTPSITFESEDLFTSSARCIACCKYLLRENETSGNTVMKVVDLRTQCLNLVGEKCIQHFPLIAKDKDIFFDKVRLEVALLSTHEKEVYIVKKIIEALKRKPTPRKIDIEKYRCVDGYELSDEQINILNVTNENAICMLLGFGGSGKTTSVNTLIKYIEDCEEDYLLLSPTGKASKVLAESTKREAFTIHRGLGYTPTPDENGNHFAYNENNKIPHSYVLIDEFSMVDTSLFYSVLKAINFDYTRLIIVGDNAQLPSVGCGNLIQDFIDCGVIPCNILTKIFRYGEGGLMKVATDARNGQKFLSKSNSGKATFYGENKDYIFVDCEDDKIELQMLQLFGKLIQQYDIEDVKVITSKNVGYLGTIELNEKLQTVANKNKQNNDFKKITCGKTTYYEDDIIMQTRNNYEAVKCDEYGNVECDDFDEPTTCFIANGDNGKIVKIFYKEESAVIKFDNIYVLYKRVDFENVLLGYSITCHKSQGSSIEVPIVVTPKSHTFMLNSNIIYVALTRMKKKCFHFGNYYTVNKAVGIKANNERHTTIQGMFEDLNI